MNIIYCVDSEEYKTMALKSAQTVLQYNPRASFHFIEKDEKNELSEFDDNLCGYKHVSRACFFRLLIPKYFKNMNRALYLDCDTLCWGSLDELYNMPFDNCYIIGCKGIDYSKKQALELGINFYINSGVLLFNIPLMNKENYFKQIKENWRESIGLPKVYSADETIINYVFHDKIKLVSEKYNYCYNRPYTGREIEPQNVKIWHFTGADKRDFDKCYRAIIH